MIAYISGKVLDINEKFAIVETSGLGYKVFCPADTLGRLHAGGNASLFTYLSVREDALDLYGFASQDEQGFFELLLTVSGIGPKGALSILSTTNTDTLKQAIASGDAGYLNKIGGIGRKTAEKIILELKDKLRAHGKNENTEVSMRAESDVVEALKSLGYSQNEARDVLKEIPSSLEGTNARIKEALKILGRK